MWIAPWSRFNAVKVSQHLKAQARTAHARAVIFWKIAACRFDPITLIRSVYARLPDSMYGSQVILEGSTTLPYVPSGSIILS